MWCYPSRKGELKTVFAYDEVYSCCLSCIACLISSLFPGLIGKRCFGCQPLSQCSYFLSTSERKQAGWDPGVWFPTCPMCGCSRLQHCFVPLKPSWDSMLLRWLPPLLHLYQLHHPCLVRSIHCAQVLFSTCGSFLLLRAIWLVILSIPNAFSSGPLVLLPLLLLYLPLSWRQCRTLAFQASSAQCACVCNCSCIWADCSLLTVPW